MLEGLGEENIKVEKRTRLQINLKEMTENMRLIVAVEDGDGKILFKQPYSEYVQGNSAIEITS